MKITRYRERFANGGLKKELDRLNSSCELYMLVAQYLEISHEESRIFRLINADVVIKDLKTIVRYIKRQLKKDISVNEMLNYRVILDNVEHELAKKQRKSKGGYKADETKKQETIVEEKWSDWVELDVHGFSVNYQYEYKFGKKVRSDAYNRWIYTFPTSQVPNKWDYTVKHGIRLDRPICIEMEFVAMAQFDVDNFSKSLIDVLFGNCWRMNDDNSVHMTICKRVGTCESYSDGLIRFRIKQL